MMERTRLKDLSPEAQTALKAMTRNELEMLQLEIRNRQDEDRLATYPTEAEGAARGAMTAIAKSATLQIEDPLEMFVKFFDVLMLVLARAAVDDLDREEAESVWLTAYMAKDLLKAHVASLDEAKDRLRAFTHPALLRKGDA